MSLNFVIPEFNINGAGTPPIQFFRRGFNLGLSGSQPTWKDVIISGTTAVTLVNAKANGLNYLKLYGGCEQRNLPEGYTQLDYIESSGTQYIATGIKPSSGYKVRCKYIKMNSASPTKPLSPFGCTTSGLVDNANKGIFRVHGLSINTNRVAYGNGIGTAVNISGYDSSDTVYDVICNAGVWTINGTVVATITSATWSSDYDIWLFARNTGDDIGLAGDFQIMLCQIWDENGNLVFDCLPCKNSSNVLGVYDLVSGQFLTNQGTGNLTAGPTATPTPDTPMDIVCNNGVIKVKDDELPVGYKRLSYIESSGAQIIDTNYVLQETDSVEVDYNITNRSRTGDKFILGCQPIPDNPNVGIWVETYEQANSWYVRFGSPSSVSTTSTTSQLSGTFKISKESFIVNGVEILQPAYNAMSPNQLTIFNRRNSNGAVPTLGGCSAKVSSVRILNGNNIIRKYIPCESPDNDLGLYEVTQGEFLTNNGSGDFTAGSYDTSHLTEIYYDGTVETVNAQGKNLFDRTTVGIEDGAIASASGRNSASASRCRTSEYVPVNPNTTYTISAVINGYAGPNGAGIFVLEYTASSGNFESNYTGTYSNWRNPSGYSFTTGATTHGIRLVFGRSYLEEISPSDISNIQLELGSTATTYEPYYDGGTATAEMLLKVGDYTDVQEILSGDITRNVGVKVLDGTENWKASGNLFYAGIATDALEDTHSCYCTHFKGVATNASANYDNEIKVGTNATQTVNWTRVQIYPVVGTYSNVTAFKQYLADQYNAGTPVIIVYPLAEPTTETATAQPLSTQAGTNIVEITQGSIDNLELEVSYKAGVAVTVEEIEAVNNDESVEVTING